MPGTVGLGWWASAMSETRPDLGGLQRASFLCGFAVCLSCFFFFFLLGGGGRRASVDPKIISPLHCCVVSEYLMLQDLFLADRLEFVASLDTPCTKSLTPLHAKSQSFFFNLNQPPNTSTLNPKTVVHFPAPGSRKSSRRPIAVAGHRAPNP